MKARLIISVPIEAETEEDVINIGRNKLSIILAEVGAGTKNVIPDDAQFSLTRDGDRSALNLLLPKTEGRMGNHYQGRKASKKEIVEGM
jgi:hypothetical protein